MRVNVYNDQTIKIWEIECSRYIMWEGNTAISFFDAEGGLMSIYKLKDGDYITFKEFVDNRDSVAWDSLTRLIQGAHNNVHRNQE